MLLNVFSIIANIVFLVALNLKLFTDDYTLPDGIQRTEHLSPIDRLGIGGRQELLYLQIALAIVSIVLSAALLLGVKNNTVKTVRLVSTIASAVLFVIIMIVAGVTHGKY